MVHRLDAFGEDMDHGFAVDVAILEMQTGLVDGSVFVVADDDDQEDMPDAYAAVHGNFDVDASNWLDRLTCVNRP